MERNGFNVKVVSRIIALTMMHILEGSLRSTVQVVSTKVQGVIRMTARVSLSITKQTKTLPIKDAKTLLELAAFLL
jgi:hypothetical protein